MTTTLFVIFLSFGGVAFAAYNIRQAHKGWRDIKQLRRSFAEWEQSGGRW